jgi:hypothetical protein
MRRLQRIRSAAISPRRWRSWLSSTSMTLVPWALGAALLPHHPAGQAIRSPVALPQTEDGPASMLRAQTFPSATSHCLAEALRAGACESSAPWCAVPAACHGRIPGPVWPAEDSHSPWTGFRGAFLPPRSTAVTGVWADLRASVERLVAGLCATGSWAALGGWAGGRVVFVAQVMVKDVLVRATRPGVRVAKAIALTPPTVLPSLS